MWDKKYARFPDENRWQTVYKTDHGPQTEFTLSYQNLLPSTGYNFRIIAYNRYGISYPVASEETVRYNNFLSLHLIISVNQKYVIIVLWKFFRLLRCIHHRRCIWSMDFCRQVRSTGRLGSWL